MRRVLVRSGIVLFVAVALLGPRGGARAADPKEAGHAVKYKATVHGPDGKEEEKEFDLSKEGHPEALAKALRDGHVEHLAVSKQPDIFGLSLDLGIWTLVVFGLLLFILRRAAWGPMLEGLQKREQNIRAAAEDAQRAREDAQRLQAQLQDQLNRASDQVREMLDEARRDAQHTKDDMVASARKEIQEERERSRREITTARDQALQEIMGQTGTLATLISSKLIRRELSGDDHRRLIDEALTELGQANVGWKDRSIY